VAPHTRPDTNAGLGTVDDVRLACRQSRGARRWLRSVANAHELGVALCDELGCDAGADSAGTKVLADRLTRDGSKHGRSHRPSGHQPKPADLFRVGRDARAPVHPARKRGSSRGCGSQRRAESDEPAANEAHKACPERCPELSSSDALRPHSAALKRLYLRQKPCKSPTLNPKVVGSMPTRPTSKAPRSHRRLFAVEQRTSARFRGIVQHFGCARISASSPEANCSPAS
jgi:hypothetical protein